MRQKRAKSYRKLMHLYCMSFGFRQPYQVLVDSETCREAVTAKLDLTKQLSNVLQGTVKPMITQCCIHALYLQGRDSQPVVDIAKTFERRRCNHRVEENGKMKEESDCIAEVVGASNAHRYVVATQSQTLRQQLRKIPGVPIVHIKRSVMVLEPVSDASENVKDKMEDDKLRPTMAESNAIASSSVDKSGVSSNEPPKQKRKGPKGPNPLSVKKKKQKDDGRRSKSTNPPSAVPKQAIDKARETQSGGKRKHDDENEDGGAAEGADASQGVGRTRKRKRRRKHQDGEAKAENDVESLE